MDYLWRLIRILKKRFPMAQAKFRSQNFLHWWSLVCVFGVPFVLNRAKVFPPFDDQTFRDRPKVSWLQKDNL